MQSGSDAGAMRGVCEFQCLVMYISLDRIYYVHARDCYILLSHDSRALSRVWRCRSGLRALPNPTSGAPNTCFFAQLGAVYTLRHGDFQSFH